MYSQYRPVICARFAARIGTASSLLRITADALRTPYGRLTFLNPPTVQIRGFRASKAKGRNQAAVNAEAQTGARGDE